MKKRTANIIMICKGQHKFGANLTLKQAVAEYVSDTCGLPIKDITDDVLRGIVFDALMDFINTADNPCDVLYKILETRYWCNWKPRENVDDITAVLIGLQMCQVRDKNGFVNGFTEELLDNPDLTE